MGLTLLDMNFVLCVWRKNRLTHALRGCRRVRG
jgi:hypothetical protein